MPNSSVILRQCDFLKNKTVPFMVEELPYSAISNDVMHSHEFSELTLVLSGTAEHRCMGRSVPVSREQVLLIHPGTEHCFANEEKFHAISILYDAEQELPQLLSCDLDFVRKMYPSDYAASHEQAEPITMIPSCDFPFFTDILLRLRYEIRHTRLGYRTIAPAIFCEMAGYLARGYSTQTDLRNNAPLKRITEYISRHYKDKISVRNLSRANGMSERSLYLAFQKNFHIGPHGYIIKMRLSRASELLGGTRLPIADIAYETGFYDSNQFCKLFRDAYQMTPRQYRKRKTEEREEDISL